MSRNVLIWAVAGIWVGLMAMSLVAALTIEPTGDGFTRGANRAGAVLSWQGSAFLVALVSAVIAGRAEATPMRWLGRAPLLVQLALALMVAAVVGYILLTAPS